MPALDVIGVAILKSRFLAEYDPAYAGLRNDMRLQYDLTS